MRSLEDGDGKRLPTSTTTGSGDYAHNVIACPPGDGGRGPYTASESDQRHWLAWRAAYLKWRKSHDER